MKIFSLLFLLCLTSMNAQINDVIISQFEKKVFSFDSTTINYRFFSPQIDGSQHTFPLILTLHGAGERGSDNEKQITFHGIATSWASQKRNPCFILSPQCPLDNKWVDVDWKNSSYHQASILISNELNAVIELVDFICQNYPVDKSRIYVTGLSMGGFGTWDLITRFPDKFAAAIPMSGAGDPSKVELIKNIPVWVFHGSADTAVPVEGSRNMVNALREIGGNVIYTELEGKGHVIWKELYENRLLQDWLFSKVKN